MGVGIGQRVQETDYPAMSSFTEHVLLFNRLIHCLAGVQDFVPYLSDEGYQGFSDLVERANSWLKDETDAHVTNMQSVMVQKNDGESCTLPRHSFKMADVGRAEVRFQGLYEEREGSIRCAGSSSSSRRKRTA
jgi:hypothetical protein